LKTHILNVHCKTKGCWNTIALFGTREALFPTDESVVRKRPMTFEQHSAACVGLLLDESSAGDAEEDQPVVADQPAVEVGEDRRPGWVKHARYYWLLLAESHLTRRPFGAMLRRIWALPLPAG
jgi:hypothetical protein